MVATLTLTDGRGAVDAQAGTAPVHPDPAAAAALGRRPTPEEISLTLQRAVLAGVFDAEDDSVLFYDLARFQARLDEVRAAFPAGTLHTLAVKANPTVALLRMAASAGLGVEVASSGEFALAEAAGIDPAAVVFDSPAKTEREIRSAVSRPLLLNANSRAELRRIAEVAAGGRARIGVRVNPGIGLGSIDHTSTATRGSKFGVPIGEVRDVVAEFQQLGGRLEALHVHVGSQGMSLEQLVESDAAVYDLLVELRATVPTLTVLDLGGGLPVSYRGDQVAPTHSEYATALRGAVPELWDGDLSLVTEFGRSLHANNGWVASRVEYVLGEASGSERTIVTHVGADLFVRAAYRPEVWQHELLVATPEGELRGGESTPFSVAGPLCFSGDYVARDIRLPAGTRTGDFLVVRDTGAYTSSMWSVYNSRQLPKSVGYGAASEFVPLTRREPLGTVVDRWSL